MIVPPANEKQIQYYIDLGATRQFAKFMAYFENIVIALAPHLPSETINSSQDFITEEVRTLGKAEVNSSWNNIANVRNGFYTDVPGMIGEVIASANLFTKHKDISHPQDKPTQAVQKIDLFADDLSIQVKVVRLEGNKLYIEPRWTEGEATHISLIDITDQEHWCILREVLEEYIDKTLTETDLENISTYHWYNFGLYPRG